jgi:DNA/RNA-binding domain of Phe-tRNA-synthetase-like protein
LQFRDILSLRTLLPWTVVDAESLLFPLVFRPGGKGETLQIDGATVNLHGVPLLTHAKGYVGSPCSTQGDETITSDTTQVIMVCYTPLSIAREYTARTELARLVWMTWAFQFIMERAFRPME